MNFWRTLSCYKGLLESNSICSVCSSPPYSCVRTSKHRVFRIWGCSLRIKSRTREGGPLHTWQEPDGAGVDILKFRKWKPRNVARVRTIINPAKVSARGPGVANLESEELGLESRRWAWGLFPKARVRNPWLDDTILGKQEVSTYEMTVNQEDTRGLIPGYHLLQGLLVRKPTPATVVGGRQIEGVGLSGSVTAKKSRVILTLAGFYVSSLVHSPSVLICSFGTTSLIKQIIGSSRYLPKDSLFQKVLLTYTVCIFLFCDQAHLRPFSNPCSLSWTALSYAKCKQQTNPSHACFYHWATNCIWKVTPQEMVKSHHFGHKNGRFIWFKWRILPLCVRILSQTVRKGFVWFSACIIRL